MASARSGRCRSMSNDGPCPFWGASRQLSGGHRLLPTRLPRSAATNDRGPARPSQLAAVGGRRCRGTRRSDPAPRRPAPGPQPSGPPLSVRVRGDSPAADSVRAAIPGCLVTEGGPGAYVTFHVYARYASAPVYRPIPITFEVSKADLTPEASDAVESMLRYGTGGSACGSDQEPPRHRAPPLRDAVAAGTFRSPPGRQQQRSSSCPLSSR